MGAIKSLFGSDDSDYEVIEHRAFDHIQLGSRNYDCVMVFDQGQNVDWKPPLDGAAIQYEYLQLLDLQDKKDRQSRFPQHGADFAQTRPLQSHFYKFERKLVVKALMKKNIKVLRITEMGKEFEKKENKVFYYVGVREPIARKFAHHIEYSLELEAQTAISYFNLQDVALARATISTEDDCIDVLKSFWQNLFVKYNSDVAPQIYKSYDVMDESDLQAGYEDSLFTIRDRCALIYEMVTQDIEVGGAGIYVPSLSQRDHCILDFFPLHTPQHLDDIMNDLFDFEHLTYNAVTLPLDKIRMYFGEYIAFYFAFLQYYKWFLFPGAIIGFLFGTYQFVEGKILVDGITIFSMLVILWTIFFPALWKNLEYWYAMKWGTLNFHENERPRPEFEGLYMRSTIDGKLFEYFPPHLRAQRRLLSLGVIGAFLLGLGASVCGIILLRIWVVNSDVPMGYFYVCCGSAFIIMFFNNVYGIFAEQMNQWENYKTQTEYENQLIIKIFVFRFVNSYATLYYYAFFRSFESESSRLYCDVEDCMQTLRVLLAGIFFTQLFVGSSIVFGGIIVRRLSMKGDAQANKNRVWKEFTSPVYPRTFDDYCKLIISFGYCTLFVISFPYALTAAFMVMIVKSRVDGYKLCRVARRPFPRQADGIGSWRYGMQFMVYAVVITNLGLLCFVTDDFDFGWLDMKNSEFEELISATILFCILFVVISIVNYLFSKEPRAIKMHEKRQGHVGKQLANIGETITRHLDSIDADDIANWKKWNADRVCTYLKAVLFHNNDEYKYYCDILTSHGFNGKKFASAEDHFADMGIGDYFVIRFIIHARQMLIDQLETLIKQNVLIDDVDGNNRRASNTSVFEFTLDNLLQMANFFEQDFAGQSKQKLWERVDKDKSSVVEKNELSVFLYYTIVVFVKSKFEDARVPPADDVRFKRDIIDPLKGWLLHYKMTSGLTFDDFDKYFAMWIREYYSERKSGSHEATILAREMNDDFKDESLSASPQHSGSGSGYQNSSGAAQDVLAAPTSDFTGFFGLNLNKNSNTLTNKEWKATENVDKSKWTRESLEWQNKMEEFAASVDRTNKETRKKLWDKFDKYKKKRLDSDKYFRYILYSLVALHVKTKDRKANPPTQQELEPFLIWLANEVRPMLKDSGDDKRYITRKDFVSNIGTYLKKVGGNKTWKGLFG